MDKLLPKQVSEDKWRPLTPSRAYAVRSGSEDFIHIRLGKGKGFYMSIVPTQFGRVIKAVDYEIGEETVLHNLSKNSALTIGRSQDCLVKIIHPYISRQHAELFMKDEILMIRDLGSINGTFIYIENSIFDIEEYLANYPLDQMKTSTMDVVHETFGPKLDDFLKHYLAQKDKIV